jgi:hypothetical protein
MTSPVPVHCERTVDPLQFTLRLHFTPESGEASTQSDRRPKDQTNDPQDNDHLKKGKSLRTCAVTPVLMLTLHFH